MTFERDRFYTAPKVHEGSDAPRAMVYEALKSGELRAIRRGRSWLIPGGAVLDWIDSLTERNDGKKP
jgi:excisionase family DNA binding protein